jgi:hypothetical protein
LLGSVTRKRLVKIDLEDSVCSTSRLSLYRLGSDHAAQKTQLLYCYRGVLSHSCLANSFGADNIENILYCCRNLFTAALPSNGHMHHNTTRNEHELGRRQT